MYEMPKLEPGYRWRVQHRSAYVNGSTFLDVKLQKKSWIGIWYTIGKAIAIESSWTKFESSVRDAAYKAMKTSGYSDWLRKREFIR